MAEPDGDATVHKPNAVAPRSLIPSKRPASENGEPTNGTPKKPKDGAEALSLKVATQKLFFPTAEELSEEELNHLSRIIFSDYLKLEQFPPASLMEEIRQFRLVKGSQVPFRLMCGFQLWLRETGQHASQACNLPTRLSNKLHRLLRDDSEGDPEPNNYPNTGATYFRSIGETMKSIFKLEETIKSIHKDNFGLLNWNQQLEQDTAEMYTRAHTRDRAIENADVIMSEIEEYSSICLDRGLWQLMKLSGRPNCPRSIRHAPKPDDLHKVMNCTAVDRMHANLIYHSLYEVLQSVDDLSVILAEGLDMLRKIRRFKQEIEEIEDPTLIDREGTYTSISVWNGNSGKEVNEVTKSVFSALKEWVPRVRVLRTEYNTLGRVDRISWDAMQGLGGSREDYLKTSMHGWILYQARTPTAMVESNDFAKRWTCWKALAQIDALGKLVWHYGRLQTALQALEESVS